MLGLSVWEVRHWQGRYIQPKPHVRGTCRWPTGGDVMSVLFAALLGGFALGQAAPNIQFFAAGKVAGGRVLGMIDR